MRKKGITGSYVMPEELLVEFDRTLTARIHSMGSTVRIQEQLSNINILKGLASIKKRYNLRAALSNESIVQSNLETYQSWKGGELTREQAQQKYIVPVREACS